MLMSLGKVFIPVALPLLFAAIASAGVVTVGGSGSENGFPFGNSSYSGRYQAEYVLPDVGAIDIHSISFSIAGGSGGTQTVSIGLAVGSNPVGSMAANYLSNAGAGYESIFSGSLTVPSSGSLVVPVSTGYQFNANGNNPLLLDIDVTGPYSGSTEFVAGADPNTERVSNLYGYSTPFRDDITLQMQVDYSVTATPEPASASFVVTGLLALAALNRRRISGLLRRSDRRGPCANRTA